MIKQDVGLSWAITMSKNSANWEQMCFASILHEVMAQDDTVTF